MAPAQIILFHICMSNSYFKITIFGKLICLDNLIFFKKLKVIILQGILKRQAHILEEIM